eukprot:Sdes_comp19027_c0_seq1m9586
MMDILKDQISANSLCEFLKHMFLIFPIFSLGRGFLDLANNSSHGSLNIPGFVKKDPLSWSITGRNILYLIIEGIVFLEFVILLEMKLFRKRKKLPRQLSREDTDEDVLHEEKRVVEGNTHSDSIVIKNLCKVYPGSQKGQDRLAVNNLCVGISPGECFGLLGVNGAGKTTTFKMLTGDEVIDYGDATIEGFSCVNEIDKVKQRIGYCPQFDAIFDKMTAKELLSMFALLRGIPKHRIDEIVKTTIANLGLTPWENRLCGTYSGGNKRKLSTGLALVGNPSIVFLDEPTTGMDPKARRFLWDSILAVMKQGRSIVLTSHSMEECEALCSRVAVMVHGKFRCLGSPQHLKNKFGSGYHLVLKLQSLQDVPNARIFIQRAFPTAVLEEEHNLQLYYKIPGSNISLSHLFSTLEKNKQDLHLDDYNFSQSLLEQVFIKFAREYES